MTDTEILDAIADDRAFDGYGAFDIDEMTLESGAPNIDTEDGWRLEWRKQMRLAIERTHGATA